MSRGSLLVSLVALLLIVGTPLLRGGSLHAQGACLSVDPPCPPRPDLAVLIRATNDTSRTTPVIVNFSVRGINPANVSSASATVNGGPVNSLNWYLDPGGMTATGSADVPLASSVPNQVTITFCNGTCVSSSTWIYYLSPPTAPARGAPIVTAEPNSQFRRALVGCAGCAYGTLSYSTPAYRSLDQDRSLSLVYSSALSAPKGLVAVDVNPNSDSLPSKISLSLIYNSGRVRLVTGDSVVFYGAGRGTNRVTAQFDASGFATGAYEMTAVVRNWWADGAMQETQLPLRVPIVNERTSGFGNGWAVAGLQRLFLGPTGHAAIAEGGRLVVFPSCGANCWNAPPDEPSSLVAVGAGVIERRFRDGTVATFNAAGLLTQVRDRLGVATSFAYNDGYNRLTHITDAAGLVTTIAWSAALGSASTATITTPGGRASTIRTDAQGQLVEILDPDGTRAMAMAYGADGIANVTDRIGGTTDFTYDSFGGLSRVIGPLVQTDVGLARDTTTYGSRELALLPAPGTGSAGVPGARVFPDSAWLRIRSQRGDSTRVTANGAGDPTRIVKRNPPGKLESTVIEYNSAGQPVGAVSTNGKRLNYRWAGLNLQRICDLVTQDTVEYGYDALGQREFTWLNGALQERNFFSADSRRLVDSTTVGNATARYTYDAIGRVLSVRDGQQHTTSFTYEPGGFQNTATLSKDGKTTQLAYDGYGRPTSVLDAAGRVDSTQFDVLNRVSRRVAPDHTVSMWGYDDASRQYTFTDAKGQGYRTVLNAAGAPVERVNPLGVSDLLKDTYRYDRDGNLTSTTSRANRTVTFTRDVMGRVAQATAGGLVTTIAYDTAGKWVAYSNAESVDSVFTDGDGRVIRQVTVRGGQMHIVDTEYGAMGERRSLNVSSTAVNGTGSLIFGVDAIGRPNFVGDFRNGNGTAITYNADHQPQTITLPTGTGGTTRLTQSLTYGANDRLNTITHNLVPNVLDQVYSYDALNRLQVLGRGVLGDATRRTVRYDLAGRLSQVADTTITTGSQIVCTDPLDASTCYPVDVYVYTPGLQESYTYDAVGNRTDRGAVVTTGNRLTSFDGSTLTYDDDGNVMSKSGPGGSWSFAWNTLGQLESVTKNGVTTTFGYDGLGRRVRKTTSGVTTSFVYDGANLVMQLDGAGQAQLQFSYYPGVDHPHAVRQSTTGAIYYYVTAQPGHVTELVNQNNQVINQYTYTPFGQALSATEQVVQPFRFTGREFDSETGLYYYRARYYDPTLGRFLSEDPVGLTGGANQYVYVGDDPVNATDPSGLVALPEIVITAPWNYKWGFFSLRTLLELLDVGGLPFQPGHDAGLDNLRNAPGGGAVAASPRQGAKAATYKAVKSCNIIGAVRQGVHTEFLKAQIAGVERGGHYNGKFSFSNTGTNAAVAAVYIPINSNARAYWHTHQDPGHLQGPSNVDSSSVVNYWKRPMIIESIDSVFLIRKNGSAIGCQK